MFVIQCRLLCHYSALSQIKEIGRERCLGKQGNIAQHREGARRLESGQISLRKETRRRECVCSVPSKVQMESASMNKTVQ